MCGLAGCLRLRPTSEPPRPEALLRMLAAMRHRGPDDLGTHLDAHAALAHARLSIIDLAGGHQPLCNENETLWIAYNGEVFNYLELRTELLALGHRFRTSSDTEVIVHAYEAWGDQAFERFNGQFAVALWDAKERALVLARDRLGVRPLHYLEHQGQLFFASEIRSIFAAEPAIERSFDPLGLAQVFTFWSPVAPRTAFRGVSQVEPGHVRTYRDGRVTDRCYWAAEFPEDGHHEFAGTFEEGVDALREILASATSLRLLRADVPVGAYVSGGLDSSLIASLAHQLKADRLVTFGIRFEDAEYDETPFQRQMVARLGSAHQELQVSRRDIAEALPLAVEHAECPILRTAPAPLYLLSQLVRASGIKAVLTGEGADELFAGYDLFREAKVRRGWASHPDSDRWPRLLERLYPYLARSPVGPRAMARQFFGRDLESWSAPGFGHAPRWRATAALQRLLSREIRHELRAFDPAAELLAQLPAHFGHWSALAQDQYLEMRTLLPGYILSSQGDRMLMAHGVEGRFPFLDPRVVALANSLPPSFKLRALDEKHVLKRVAAGLVPDPIVRRKKQPYRAPDASALVGTAVEDWLEPRAVARAGIFDPAAVALLRDKVRRSAEGGPLSNSDNMAFVGVISAQILADRVLRLRASPATTQPVQHTSPAVELHP